MDGNLPPIQEKSEPLQPTARKKQKNIFFGILLTVVILGLIAFFFISLSPRKQLAKPATQQNFQPAKQQPLSTEQLKSLMLKNYASLKFPDPASQQETTQNSLPAFAQALIMTGASQINASLVTYADGKKGFEVSYNFNKALPAAHRMLVSVLNNQGREIMGAYGDTFGYVEGEMGGYQLKIYEYPLGDSSVNFVIDGYQSTQQK